MGGLLFVACLVLGWSAATAAAANTAGATASGGNIVADNTTAAYTAADLNTVTANAVNTTGGQAAPLAAQYGKSPPPLQTRLSFCPA